MDTPRFGRDETKGIAERTLKNLILIENSFKNEHEGHVITQLVCSLLGFVVFPWEKSVLDRTGKTMLASLASKGWPQWEVLEGHSETLEELIRNLRHGIAHSHIRFSSDSRHLTEVVIEIANPGGRPPWKGRIRGDQLREFCVRFHDYILDVVW